MTDRTKQEISRDSLNREESLDWQHSLAGNVPDFEIVFPNLTLDFVNIRADKDIFDQGSTFILGHPDMGELGDDRLGSVVGVGSLNIRIAEARMYQEFFELYTGSDFRDDAVTSAFWFDSGSILFGAGSEVFDVTDDFASGLTTANVGSEGGSLILT